MIVGSISISILHSAGDVRTLDFRCRFIYIQRKFYGVVLIYKAYSYMVVVLKLETRCEGSDIYETRIILAVYIQGPAAGFSTSPC